MTYHNPSYDTMSRFVKSFEINPMDRSFMYEYMLRPGVSIAPCFSAKSISVEARRYIASNVYLNTRISTRGNGSFGVGFTIPGLPGTFAPRFGVALVENGLLAPRIQLYGKMGFSFELGEC